MLGTDAGKLGLRRIPLRATKPAKKFLVALTYWDGDKAAANDLARLIADLQPEKSNEVDFLFAMRNGGTIDRATVEYVARKFNVWTLVGNRRDKGWPNGCNAIHMDMLHWVANMMNNGKLDPSGVLLVESDCCPIYPDWLNRIMNEWKAAQAAGCEVLGHIQCPPENRFHVNAAGVYMPNLVMKYPQIIGAPGCGWDWHFGPLLQPVSKSSKEIYMDYNKATTTEEELYAPRVRFKEHPNGTTPYKPCFIHGVKDDSARKIVRRKFL